MDARPERRAPAPSAVRTLIQRRAARLPDETKQDLADAAILGRSFSLKDLHSIKVRLGADEEDCSPTVLAESLAPAAQAGLLLEHSAGSPRTTASPTTRSASSPPRCSPPSGGVRSTRRSSTC